METNPNLTPKSRGAIFVQAIIVAQLFQHTLLLHYNKILDMLAAQNLCKQSIKLQEGHLYSQSMSFLIILDRNTDMTTPKH